jgi:hypothetical protein
MSKSKTTSAKPERRTLRFNSVDELLAEIDRIVSAEKAGTLRRTGNWSTGQIFGHLAAWIDYGYEGFPPGAHPPFFVRWVMKFWKKKIIRDGMPAGIRIPRTKDGTFGTEPYSADEGAARLRAALKRLSVGEPVKFHSPAMGPVSEAERIQVQLRHAELHLSYLHP